MNNAMHVTRRKGEQPSPVRAPATRELMANHAVAKAPEG